jgi:hypothetical protein
MMIMVLMTMMMHQSNIERRLHSNTHVPSSYLGLLFPHVFYCTRYEVSDPEVAENTHGRKKEGVSIFKRSSMIRSSMIDGKMFISLKCIGG